VGSLPAPAVPEVTVPFRLATEVHPSLELIPFRVSRHLLATRPVGRVDFPELLGPFDDILGLAPCEAARHSRLGSALRLSQPLSGFLAGPSFVALFRATTVPGIPPFRGFPSQEIARPSRGSLAPLQLSTHVRGRVSFDRSPAVSSTPTRSRGCLVPPTAMSSLLARRSGPPGHSRSRATESARSVSFTCFEASIPPASPFTVGSGFPSPIGRSSPGLLPL